MNELINVALLKENYVKEANAFKIVACYKGYEPKVEDNSIKKHTKRKWKINTYIKCSTKTEKKFHIINLSNQISTNWPDKA